MTDHALVLFSGGQNSATCLAWALARFGHVETLGFDYGQRHRIELDQRAPFRDWLSQNAFGAKLGDDHLLPLAALGAISETSLTREIAIEMQTGGLPNTFVPGRNLIFLTFAAALAFRRGLKHIVTGVCETDYSGYPDCRDDTIKALQVALNLGMDPPPPGRFVLQTPLMWRDKRATWDLAETLGGAPLVEAIRALTHSCYLGDRTPRPWGAGCGACPACELRARGWDAYVEAKR